MTVLVAAAGAKLHIGPEMEGTGSAFDEDDFEESPPPVFVEIGGLINLGEAGDTAEVINVTTLNDARVRKLKGPRNAGAMTVIAALDSADAGQAALIAAEATSKSYAFKLTFNDAPTGGTPSIRYFVAFVMSCTEQVNEATNVISLQSVLEIDSNIVKVAAAA